MKTRPVRLLWCAAAVAGGIFILLASQFFLRNLREPELLDFTSYWAAGRLALAGSPWLAFDLDALRAMQGTVLGTVDGIMPFPYPPPFLLLATPVASLPYFPAFVVWLAVTGALYLWAARRFTALPFATAQPAVLINSLIGQNGFLTAGIFMAGAARLTERPFVAGLILGTLVIKPQLALLLPVAVIAARAWPAIAGGALSACALLLAALAAFGWQSYAAFWAQLPQFARWMADDRFTWKEFASPFAFLRFLDVPAGAAMAVQVAIGLAAALLCWKAWREKWDERIVVLCAGSLLVSPYLQAYDTLLMLVPIGWWIGRSAKIAGALWLLCFLPIAGHLEWWPGPDTSPIAAILTLGLVWNAHRSRAVERVLAPA